MGFRGLKASLRFVHGSNGVNGLCKREVNAECIVKGGDLDPPNPELSNTKPSKNTVNPNPKQAFNHTWVVVKIRVPCWVP